MIIETLFSTMDSSGQVNFAPMGIVWGEASLTVRPFRATQTYRNLLATGCGVVNLTDDVLAFVQSALYKQALPWFPAEKVTGAVFRGACAWHEVQVIPDPAGAFGSGTPERAEIDCRTVHHGRLKEFLGVCRAHGAVLEAAILATRLNQYTPEAVEAKMREFAIVVEKTGGENERQAFYQVENYIRSATHD